MHSKNQCIIAEGRGKIGFFLYLSDSLKLVCRTKRESLYPAEGELFLADNVSEFDAAIDKSNTLHIVYTSQNGTLNYIRHGGGKWLRCTLSEKGAVECPVLHVQNDAIFVIYSYLRLGKRLLCRLSLTDFKSRPERLAVLARDSCFHTAYAPFGGIYLFFCNPSGDFICQSIHLKANQTAIKLPIARAPQHITDFHAVYHKGKIRVCYAADGAHFFRSISKNGEATAPTRFMLSEFDECEAFCLASDENRLSFMGFNRQFVFSKPLSLCEHAQSITAKKLPIPRGGQIFAFKLCRTEDNSPRFGLCSLSGGRVFKIQNSSSVLPSQSKNVSYTPQPRIHSESKPLNISAPRIIRGESAFSSNSSTSQNTENDLSYLTLANEISLLRTEIAELKVKLENFAEFSASGGTVRHQNSSS